MGFEVVGGEVAGGDRRVTEGTGVVGVGVSGGAMCGVIGRAGADAEVTIDASSSSI